MALTTAQLQALKADILADATLAAIPNNSDGNVTVANAYNQIASPAFSVWRTEVPVRDIFDAINWALYTPSGAVDDATLTTQLVAEQRIAQLMVSQTKQMNLQNMTIGRATLDASKANIRAGLRDATIQVPAGAAGANVSPGGASGATVLTACTRSATRAEKLFAGATATTGSTAANLLVFEGQITPSDVNTALNS